MNAADVAARLQAYCDRRFGGDRRAMFDHYAVGGGVARDGLTRLLLDADVGNRFTRPVIVGLAFNLADSDGDRVITWDEFVRVAPPASTNPGGAS